MKQNLIDQIFKITVAIGILIVCLSVGYYFVLFLPQKENQKIELQKIEQEKKEQQEEQQQRARENRATSLSTCLSEAESNYSRNWGNECRSQGLLSSKCILLMDMTTVEYAKEKGLELNAETLVKFLKEKNDCSCRLSFGISDRIEGLRKDAKEQCHKQFGN